MKNLKFNYLYCLLIVLLLGTLSSCIDDKGNYDYLDPADVMSVKIEDLPEEILSRKDLNLSPTLKNLKEGTEYSYQWVCHPQTDTGEIQQLATTKDLSLDISFLLPAKYVLIFEIKDVAKDVYVKHKMVLEVQATEIQRGWYLLKDKDNMTDFDYISLEDKLYENVLRDHSAGGNLQLTGKAVQIAYDQAGRYNHQIIENGNVVSTLSRQKVFHIISDQDFSIINAANIGLFKKFDQAFFETPSVTKPESVICSASTIFLQNAGKVHTISNNTVNIGMFGYPAVFQNDYSFTETNMIDNTTESMVFDKTNRSFRRLSQGGGNITSFNDFPTGTINPAGIASPNNMDADLIQMLQARVAITGRITTGVYSGVAIMKSTTKDEHYIALMELQRTNTYPFVRIDTIKDSSHPVLTAPFRAATREGTFIYYTNSQGNELWAYNFGTPEKKLIKTFAPNEKITCIYNYMAAPTDPDQILIATSVSGMTWKLYQFEKIGAAYPDLKNESPKVFEGEGTVRYMLYRQF